MIARMVDEIISLDVAVVSLEEAQKKIDFARKCIVSNESHLHKCNQCGKIWDHTNYCFGKVKEHQCPNCGEEQYWQHSLSMTDIRSYVEQKNSVS